MELTLNNCYFEECPDEELMNVEGGVYWALVIGLGIIVTGCVGSFCWGYFG